MSELDWQRVSPLLDELFELEADARAARLTAIESTDAALAAELARLLAADRTGGMGEVWRGERSDDFEQEVAIKLIRPLMDSPQLRERFARERRILARLDHPNIARLLDGGVSADGTPWYAMEFVRGSDLLAWASERQLGVRARVELLLQVCDAVAQAQAQLVVHRDLKPSNILVDAAGRARVLDFGIARLLDDSGELRLTGTGVRVYSPAYAAPEQIRGDAVGTAADVFSLGAVLYELLTGELAHPRRRATPDHLLAGLERETAPRPSHSLREKGRKDSDAPWVSLAREVHGDLDLIVATALHPDPARRYVGAAQLGDDLRRWLDGHPIAARADTAAYRMRKFASRHRLAVASFGAVLLALLAGLGLSLWQMDLAREQARRADEEARRLERTYRFVISVFDSIQPSRGGGGTPQQTVQNLLRSGLARIDDELPDLPDVRAGLRAQWSGLLISMGHSDEGLPLLEQAASEFESQSPHLDSDLASALIKPRRRLQGRGASRAGRINRPTRP